MSKFSPGPWQWVRGSDGHRLEGATAVILITEDDPPAPDRRLIAAAPEMHSLLAAMPRLDLFDIGTWSERDIASYRRWVAIRDALFARIDGSLDVEKALNDDAQIEHDFYRVRDDDE